MDLVKMDTILQQMAGQMAQATEKLDTMGRQVRGHVKWTGDVLDIGVALDYNMTLNEIRNIIERVLIVKYMAETMRKNFSEEDANKVLAQLITKTKTKK